VLDVGCGSGVLAIAAARLGFAPVVAVDVEEAAVEATQLNAAANGVAVETRRLDALVDELPPADTVLANIALETVRALGPRLRAQHVVTSGYLTRDAPDLPAYRRVGRRDVDGWAADLHERR
jgi:ribosomal protein L11 methyltransferase